MIKAKKGKLTKEFSDKVWAEMPEGKYGWIPVAEVPEEITRLKESEGIPPVAEVPEEKKTKPTK